MPAAGSQAPRFLTIISVLAMATILSGCMVGPNYDRPNILVPGSWSKSIDKGQARPAELAYWWTKLNDPLLNSYVKRAQQGNLTVAAAAARVREARAMLEQENGKLFPSLGNSSSLTRTKTAEASSTTGVDNPLTQYRSGFDASWEIDLFGGKRRSVEAASYGFDASEEELRNIRLVLIGDVASNYVQVRASQARMSLAQRTARSQRESAALTRSKFEGGSATTVDVARAEAIAASTEADIPTFEINRAIAVNRLGVLLGLPPAALSAELSKTQPIPRPRFPLPAGIPADVLLARPDVRVAERQLAQSTARIGVAEAARYPSVSLTGNIASQALNLGDLAEKSTIGWAIGPSISIPLFRGGQLKAAVEVTRAARDQSAARYQSAVLTAMEDVENAIVSMNQQRVRSGKLSTAVSAYRRADKASRTQYDSGALNYLDLLDGQRQLYTAEGALIDSQLSVTLAFIALNKALGGGWPGKTAGDKALVVAATTSN